MNDERTGKRRQSSEQGQPGEQERERQAGSGQRRDEPQRKPDRAKQGEWRGSGVCGDRHTD